MKSISLTRPRLVIQHDRGLGVADARAESPDMRHRVRRHDRDAERPCDLPRLCRGGLADCAGVRVVHDRANSQASQCTWDAIGNVADRLLRVHRGQVEKRLGLEAGVRPDPGDPVRFLGGAARNRRSCAPRTCRCGEHGRVPATHASASPRRRMGCLHGEDDQVDLLGLHLDAGAQTHYPVTTGTFDAQPTLGHGDDVFDRGCDCNDVAPARGQQAGIYGTHGATTDNCDLHAIRHLRCSAQPVAQFSYSDAMPEWPDNAGPMPVRQARWPRPAPLRRDSFPEIKMATSVWNLVAIEHLSLHRTTSAVASHGFFAPSVYGSAFPLFAPSVNGSAFPVLAPSVYGLRGSPTLAALSPGFRLYFVDCFAPSV